MHVTHDLTLPPNRQVWLAQNKVKDSDLDEGSPDRLGSALELADSAPDTTPLPAPPKPSAAQGAVIPAALKERVPSTRPTVAVAAPIKETPEPPSSNGTVVLDVEQGGIEVPSFLGKSVRGAIETAQDSGLELNPVGSGLAREQFPMAGRMSRRVHA